MYSIPYTLIKSLLEKAILLYTGEQQFLGEVYYDCSMLHYAFPCPHTGELKILRGWLGCDDEGLFFSEPRDEWEDRIIYREAGQFLLKAFVEPFMKLHNSTHPQVQTLQGILEGHGCSDDAVKDAADFFAHYVEQKNRAEILSYTRTVKDAWEIARAL